MALRDLAISRGTTTVLFDPHIIRENPLFNTRDMNSPETVAHIRQMAEAIKENGNEAFPPITIYQDGEEVFVRAGWCRRRAHELAMDEGAPIKGIVCITVTKGKPEDATLNILSSNDGLPLTQMEKAEAIARLKKFSWSPADIARKTGWSVNTILNLLELYNAPDVIATMVANKEVSATFATKLMKEKGPEEALRILQDAREVAKETGKKKTTQKDLQAEQNAKAKKINWLLYGPKIRKLLNDIYETPVTNRDKQQDKIMAAGELLTEMEDKYGEIGELG